MHWYDNNELQSAGTAAPLLNSGIYADDYHIFGIEWDADQIKWFIDSTQFYSHSITASALSEFHQPFYFLLNLAVGGDWPGSPDSSTIFPQSMYVDYVRVFRKEEGTTGLNEKSKDLAAKFVLQQNYPNPFNPSTKVNFGLDKNSIVSLSVFNALGQRVKSIINNQDFSSGVHEIQIDMSDHSSGVYFLVLKEQNNVQVRKMTLLK
jgi:beta-glucanase (GH16 family)